MTAPRFKVGDRVERIENREVTGATVTAVDALGPDEIYYALDYDEGGDGSWPEIALKAEGDPDPEPPEEPPDEAA